MNSTARLSGGGGVVVEKGTMVYFFLTTGGNYAQKTRSQPPGRQGGAAAEEALLPGRNLPSQLATMDPWCWAHGWGLGGGGETGDRGEPAEKNQTRGETRPLPALRGFERCSGCVPTTR